MKRNRFIQFPNLPVFMTLKISASDKILSLGNHNYRTGYNRLGPVLVFFVNEFSSDAFFRSPEGISSREIFQDNHSLNETP